MNITPNFRYPPAPMANFHGTMIEGVSLGNNANTGAYLRDLIKYLVDHVIQMRENYLAKHLVLKRMFPHPNQQARMRFWMDDDMRRDNRHLTDITREITWAVRRIFDVHQINGSAIQFLNLQRRCEYMLELCIGALCDMRALDVNDYLHTPNQANVHLHHLINDTSDYCSGLAPTHQVGQVNSMVVNAPYIYPTNDNGGPKPRLKLPHQFIMLIRFMTPGPVGRGNRPFDVSLLIQLLARYCLFLSYIIWFPDFIFQLKDKDNDYFYKPDTIFNLTFRPQTETDLHLMHQELKNQILDKMFRAPQSNVKDSDVVQTQPKPWPDQMPFCDVKDLHFPPASAHNWALFIDDDKYADTKYCCETIQDKWHRMMMF